MEATADLCDQLGDEIGVLPYNFRSYGKVVKFSGKAVTVLAPEDNSKVREALEKDGQGAVLVIDGGSSRNCALLGGNLGQLAVRNGWAGVVVLGMIRDSVEIDAEPLGVRALGTCPRKSDKRGLGEIGVPLNLGGLLVNPGDHIIADEDGVLVLPETLLNKLHQS